MKFSKTLEHKCNYRTERLLIRSWTHHNKGLATNESLEEDIINILSSKVTNSLPDGWQRINTSSDAQKWMEDRDEESNFLTVELLATNEIIGFIFLYELNSEKNSLDLRFGYLLSESNWSKGFGTELVKGLVKWCETMKTINSISGGVEIDNLGSIRVLEKTGFSPSTIDSPSENVIFYELKFNY